MRTSLKPHHIVAVALLAPGLSADASVATLFSASGANPAAIQGTVDDFRDALGDLNPFVATEFADGRRQINWDAAPAAISSPNPFPGDFFNFSAPPRARGIEFSTPGKGFALSGDQDDGTAIRFADINPTYENEFQAFSEERLFTPRGSHITRVDFFSAADQTTRATTDGLGVVFADVDLPYTTTIDYYGLDGTLLLNQYVETADKGLSFAGAKFTSNELAYAIITTGNFDIGPTDGAFGYDVVVLDDFIFGEPIAVPEPASALLLGLGSLAMLRRRQA